MDYVLDYLKKYDCHFDNKNKIFTIRKPISVKEFLYVRKLLKFVNMDIYDIRIETNNNLRLGYERRF